MYGTKTLPVVLCGCETWSVVLREEHRLRVLGRGMLLRDVFGAKREEVTGDKCIARGFVLYTPLQILAG